MTHPTMTNRAAFAGGLLVRIGAVLDLLGRFPMAILEVMFRVGVASVFFKSGLLKLDNWDLTMSLFADEYKVPLLAPGIAAFLAAFFELTCAPMIAFGLGARLGAAALLGMTLVIQTFVYPENWSEHLIWAALLGYVLTRGPGPISLDYHLWRWLTARRG
ncbi:MAG: DoxX family protein [Pseudomonadota bacterium]